MTASAALRKIEELERCRSIGYEYGAEARRLILEEKLDPEAVIDTAVRFTTARSLAELCIDTPDKVTATDHASRKLVLQAARLRVKSNGTLKPEPVPTASVAGTATRSREARGRRSSSRTSRGSPNDDSDLPETLRILRWAARRPTAADQDL